MLTFYGRTLAALLVALAVAGCNGSGDDDDDGGGGPTDTTRPTVLSTSPANSATNVPINATVIARFSEAMAPATINVTTFRLTGPGATVVAGTVSYNATTHVATLTPTTALAASTLFTAIVDINARDVAGNSMASPHSWTFTSGTSADSTPPTVLNTTPADAAVGVAVNIIIIARFSEAMNPLTIIGANFSVTGPGATFVAGTVTYDSTNNAANFDPNSDLAANTVFTATIEVGVEDLAGNALVSAFDWDFTTGTGADVTAPTITFVSPTDQATNVPIDQNVTALFNEPMDTTSLNSTTFTLRQNGTISITGIVTSNGTLMTFNPASDLAANATFTAVVTVGVTDAAGNPMAAEYEWLFSTGTATDTTPPTVISTDPANSATNVPINQIVSATFSELMNTTTVNGMSFTLMAGAVSVAGTVACPGTTATFTPTSNLAGSTVYTATITTAVTDVAGNALAAEAVWTFTTGLAAALGPAPVVLGTAIDFVILAKSAVSTTGVTAITGNIGLSPAAGSFLTGFSETMDATNVFSTSAAVTGQLFAADYAPPTPTNLTTAILDMQTAYTDAAGRTLPDFTELGSGNINGLTLVPGLYKWGTGVSFTNGVTISGAANDIWIFQIGADLAVGNGAIVTLLGGAQAKNIYWQVAGTTTLGTTSDFKGIVLCQTQIAFNTGAIFVGRALAQTAVTLDATTITAP